MIRRPPRSTLSSSSAASDVYKRQVLSDATDLLERHIGGTASVRRRLEALGRGQGVPEFRVEQVVWAALGLLAALAAIGIGALTGKANPLSAVMLTVAGVVGGVLGRDYWLTVQVRRREGAATSR